MHSTTSLLGCFVGQMSTADGSINILEKVAVRREDTHRHILSIAQDIVHVGTQGRVRTPKHFMLPLTVQHLTRSSKLVTMLNRFGHGYTRKG